MTEVEHKPTDEQQAVIDAVAQGSGSIMIEAYAGCTKTTALQMAAPSVKGYALATSFSRKTVAELGKKMPQNFKCQSLNGLGHVAWGRRINRMEMKPDDAKLGKLLPAVLKDRKIPLLRHQWTVAIQGVKAAMLAGISPNNEGQPLLEDTPENWADIIEDATSDELELLTFVCRSLLIESINLAKAGQISFDDQVYCPTILGGAWPQYPVVFADEFQDFSPLNHRMIELVSRGRIAAVGDTKQAIYKFRGADPKSMASARRLRPSWTDLMLTMTFRCPRVIVARQQSHAPGYRAFEGNPEGLFLENPSGSYFDNGWSWDNIKRRLSDINAKQPAILCRNNAPIVDMAFKLIANGIGCAVLGRDIGKGLIRLTQKLASDDKMPIVKFSILMTEWLDKECAIARANQKEARADRITDQVECLRAAITGASPSTVGDLRDILERMFSRESGQVTLSTIHRAKGLEWPLVIHLNPWMIPSKQARMAALSGDPSHMEQEHNLRYVAETRSQHILINANLEGFVV